MSRICIVTGRKTSSGNKVSHSNIKTKRKWKINLVKKKIFLEDENRYVTVRISTKALRTLAKKGLKAAMKKNKMPLSYIAPKKYVGVESKTKIPLKKKTQETDKNKD